MGKRRKAKPHTQTPLKTPSVAEVNGLPKLKDVFIHHEDMVETQVHGDQYYKMMIVLIHRDKNGETIWILSAWCYEPQEMEKVGLADSDDIITSLGKTKLIKTDHYRVINAEAIKYICNMHHFNNSGTTCFPILEEFLWFNQLTLRNWDKNPILLESGINQHCICNKFYNPVTMVQHFCKSCKVWFDESCLMADGDPALLEGATATAILHAVPYVHGYKMKPARWTMIGTGIVHELVEMHADEVDLNSPIEKQWTQWDNILRNEDVVEVLAPKINGYVTYVRKMKFSWFQCAHCKE